MTKFMKSKLMVAVTFICIGVGGLLLRSQSADLSSESSSAKKDHLNAESLTDVPTNTISPPGTKSPGENILTQKSSDKTLSSAENKFSVYNRPQAEVLARLRGGRWVVQEDIMINDGQVMSNARDGDVAIARISAVNYWENGVVPFVVESEEIRNNVALAIRAFNEQTKVRFVERESESDYLVFRTTPEDVCQSYLGRRGGEQEVLVHSSCSVGQMIHELMHSLGFVHEHSREDRDDYVSIHWDNVTKPQLNQFQKIAARVSIPVRAEFDFESILLYPSTAFSRNGQPTITKINGDTFTVNRTGLSELDIAKVDGLYRR